MKIKLMNQCSQSLKILMILTALIPIVLGLVITISTTIQDIEIKVAQLETTLLDNEKEMETTQQRLRELEIKLATLEGES